MRYRAPHSIRTKLTPILHHSTFPPQTSPLHTPDAFSDRRAGVERFHLLAVEIRHVCCLFSAADAVGCDLKGGLNNYVIIHELPCLGVNNYKRSLIKEALLFLFFFLLMFGKTNVIREVGVACRRDPMVPRQERRVFCHRRPEGCCCFSAREGLLDSWSHWPEPSAALRPGLAQMEPSSPGLGVINVALQMRNDAAAQLVLPNPLGNTCHHVAEIPARENIYIYIL